MSFAIKDEHGKTIIQKGQKLLGSDSPELIVKDISEKRREYTMCISSSAPDRSGDVVVQEGISFKNYDRNSVILWAHRHDLIPCGRCIEHWQAESGGVTKTFMRIQHSESEDSMKVFNAVKSGYLKASSIGFLNLKSEKIPQADGKDKSSIFGEPTKFLETELIEVSICPVGMSADALVQMTASGRLPAFYKSCGDCARCTCNDNEIDLLDKEKIRGLVNTALVNEVHIERALKALDADDEVDILVREDEEEEVDLDDFPDGDDLDDDLDDLDLTDAETKLLVQHAVREALRSALGRLD